MAFTPQTREELKDAVNLYPEGGYGDINGWDISQIHDLSDLFDEKPNFNENISRWDVSNVTNMSNLFFQQRRFNQPLHEWGPRLGNVTDMSRMFCGARAFNQDISSWGHHLGNVITMEDMFRDARLFRQSLATWRVPKLINFGGSNSQITHLFPIPHGLSVLHITNCKITELAIPLLNELGDVELEGNPFNLKTVHILSSFFRNHPEEDYRYKATDFEEQYRKRLSERQMATRVSTRKRMPKGTAIEIVKFLGGKSKRTYRKILKKRV